MPYNHLEKPDVKSDFITSISDQIRSFAYDKMSDMQNYIYSLPYFIGKQIEAYTGFNPNNMPTEIKDKILNLARAAYNKEDANINESLQELVNEVQNQIETNAKNKAKGLQQKLTEVISNFTDYKNLKSLTEIELTDNIKYYTNKIIPLIGIQIAHYTGFNPKNMPSAIKDKISKLAYAAYNNKNINESLQELNKEIENQIRTKATKQVRSLKNNLKNKLVEKTEKLTGLPVSQFNINAGEYESSRKRVHLARSIVTKWKAEFPDKTNLTSEDKAWLIEQANSLSQNHLLDSDFEEMIFQMATHATYTEEQAKANNVPYFTPYTNIESNIATYGLRGNLANIIKNNVRQTSRNLYNQIVRDGYNISPDTARSIILPGIDNSMRPLFEEYHLNLDVDPYNLAATSHRGIPLALREEAARIVYETTYDDFYAVRRVNYDAAWAMWDSFGQVNMALASQVPWRSSYYIYHTRAASESVGSSNRNVETRVDHAITNHLGDYEDPVCSIQSNENENSQQTLEQKAIDGNTSNNNLNNINTANNVTSYSKKIYSFLKAAAAHVGGVAAISMDDTEFREDILKKVTNIIDNQIKKLKDTIDDETSYSISKEAAGKSILALEATKQALETANDKLSQIDGLPVGFAATVFMHTYRTGHPATGLALAIADYAASRFGINIYNSSSLKEGAESFLIECSNTLDSLKQSANETVESFNTFCAYAQNAAQQFLGEVSSTLDKPEINPNKKEQIKL